MQKSLEKDYLHVILFLVKLYLQCTPRICLRAGGAVCQAGLCVVLFYAFL